MEKNIKVGIVGLGLIGGSIFKAFCKLGATVYGTSRSLSTVEKAKKYSENVSQNFEILKNCDVVFVCTPMSKTIEVLRTLENVLDENTIVTDVCSLKSFVAKEKFNYKFIPSHPMAGTEFSGFDNSFETLFIGANWAITPFKDTAKNDLDRFCELIVSLGAKPILTTPQKHDEAVAIISHMPMVIAQAIFKSAENNELALHLASSGFRDMTRLALSNEEMATDMVNMNYKNIQNSLLSLYSSVGELLKDDYPNKIKDIKNRRQNMYVDGKNVY